MNLLWVVTGAVSCSITPFWARWIRLQRPDICVEYVMTPSATRFLSPAAIKNIGAAPVMIDKWDDVGDRPLHVEMSVWLDAIIVHPCTFDYMSRLALGIVNTPSLLTAACIEKPIIVAPIPPPGGMNGPVYKKHLESLAERGNITVLPPEETANLNPHADQSFGAASFESCLRELQ
ncbi:flavoprotein [Nocardia sp. CA-290969]|uniref:flavoprotein n=1 Tax=Nocardia sp. CA-290969 TaxID=3239986 RepID=UPI003D8CA234